MSVSFNKAQEMFGDEAISAVLTGADGEPKKRASAKLVWSAVEGNAAQ